MRWTVMLVLILAGCSTPQPAARTPPAPIMLTVNGQHRCACAPVPTGCYTAKHCFLALPRGAVMKANGVTVTRYTLDPARDLAHIPLGADPDQELGAPGGVAEWLGKRHGHAVFRLGGVCVGPVYVKGRLSVQEQDEDLWCYAKDGIPGGLAQHGDDVIRPGDSGGGFYVDGRLVGILSLYDAVGCAAWTVRVP